MKQALLINPPIYDFAAYDFWMKPYGLLRIGRLLSRKYEVFLFDFMDRNHPSVAGKTKGDPYGRGKYYRIYIEKPEPVREIRRRFKRYGVPREVFLEEVRDLYPEVVVIATGMTYWYLGVREVVEDVRRMFPQAKIVLGGIHASLMPEFLNEMIKPDLVVVADRLELLFEMLGIEDGTTSPPVWELYKKLDYGVLKLQDGCPFRCPYCATWILSPKFKLREVDEVLDELDHLLELGVKDIAFYDDALLLAGKRMFPIMLEYLEKRKARVRFHTPNALHARFLTREIAHLMKKLGFTTIYIGLETVDSEKQKLLGNKVTNAEFEEAIENLLNAGFKKSDITVYLLMGLPGQPPEEVEEGIRYVHSLGLKVMLSEFSPIPGTPLFEESKKIKSLDDPLLHNPSVFPILNYGEETVKRLKDLKNQLNRKLVSKQGN